MSATPAGSPSSTARPRPSDRIVRVVESLSRFGGAATAILVLAVCGLVVLDVVTRWIGVSALFIANVVLLCTIWLSYLGVAHAHRDNGHIGVDTVVQLLPPSWRRRLAVLNELICLLLIGVVVWSAWQQVALAFTYQSRMLGALRMPLWIAQSALLCGATMLGMQAAVKLARLLGWRDEPPAAA